MKQWSKKTGATRGEGRGGAREEGGKEAIKWEKEASWEGKTKGEREITEGTDSGLHYPAIEDGVPFQEPAPILNLAALTVPGALSLQLP